MADAFTLSIKVEAAKRFIEKAGWSGALIVGGWLEDLSRHIAAGTPLPAIKERVIEARGMDWIGRGSAHPVWSWWDRWSFDLAEYLSTDEELLTLKELSDRFHADLEAAREAQAVSA
jgi:hypothetical protein